MSIVETVPLEIHLWRAIGSVRIVRGVATIGPLEVESQIPKRIGFPDDFRKTVGLHMDGSIDANTAPGVKIRQYELQKLVRIEKRGKISFRAEYREVENGHHEVSEGRRKTPT